MTPPPEHRVRALSALERVLKGRSICDFHFYSAPILLFDDHEQPLPHEAWLTIGSSWRTSNGEAWNSFDTASLARLATFAVSSQHSRVLSISVDVGAPHLVLTFGNGGHLHVNGSNGPYESWDLRCGDISVVAAPGDRIMLSA